MKIGLKLTVLLCIVVVVHCHMTGICLSRISNGKLHVAVEHWHGSIGVRAGSSFAIRQGSLSVSGPWQAPLACGCPPAGCGTSYFDCGTACTGNGVWYAVVDDPGFTYPGNVLVDAINGGSVTDRCGVCTGNGVTTTANVPLPPPASTCFAQICGDGIISGGEVCEAGGACAPGYPTTTCGSCCLTGTPCCQTGTARCRSTSVDLNSSGTASVSVASVNNGSNLSPDCPQSGYPQVTPSTITCAGYPSTTVALSVGPAGGAETCIATVTVNDLIGPSISCPSPISTNTGNNVCTAAVPYTTPVGTDNCPSTTTRTAGLASNSNFPVGTTTNTFRVTDQAGSTAVCSFTVTVTDTQAPQIDGTQGSVGCPSPITVPNTLNSCSAAVSFTTPSGTDACPGANTARTAGFASGSSFPVGTTTQAYVVTDSAGLMASCSFTVTVTDSQAPSISCPAPITVNSDPNICGAVVNYAVPSGTDNCAGATTARIGGLGSGNTFPVGTTTETYRVTDLTGSTNSCSFTVTVNDGQDPVIDGTASSTPCPASFSANTDPDLCSAVVPYSLPIGTDQCPGASTARTGGLASGAVFPLGPTSTQYTVTDAAGRTNSCSFAVTVIDAQDPVIDGSNGSIGCPAPFTAPTETNRCDAVVNFATPSGTDQCPGATTAQSGGLPSGATYPLGITSNEYTVTDAAGRFAQCFFTVTVEDRQDPYIDGSNGSTGCPASFAVNTFPSQCGAYPNYITPVGTDSCAGVGTARTQGLPSGSFFPVGSTPITFVATDMAGNTASCSFVVDVNDSEQPTIDGSNGSSGCPAPVTINAEVDSCDASFTYNTPLGTDQCPGAITAQTSGLPSGSDFPVGTTTNTYTVTDAALLTASCSFGVTVVDNQAPQIDGSQGSTPCPASIAVNSDFDVCGAVVSYVAPVGTDACPGATTARTSGLGSGALFPAPGPTTETYVVTDAFGQTASCSFTVSVSDIQSPVIDGSNGSTPCPAAMTVNTDTGVCQASVTYVTPSGTDQCSATTALTGGLASGSTFPIGTTQNFFVATDPAGNTDSCSFTVTVVDNENPRIDGTLGSTGCPSSIAVNNDAGQCGARVTYTTPVGTDGCPGATTAQTAGLGTGAFFPVGTTTETYVVTDATGRSASCSFSVTVIDNEAPTLNSSDGFTPCMPPVVVPTDSGVCSAVVNYPVPAGIDNCGTLTPSLVSGLGTGGSFPQFTSTETYTVSDGAGNSVTCSFDVVVEDREPPVISHSPPGVVQVFPGDTYGYTISMTDNCSPNGFTHMSGPMPGDSSTTSTDPISVWFEGEDLAGNTVQYEFQVQTIRIADGIPDPTYMYLPMTLDVAASAFAPGDTHVTYQLRPIGNGPWAFESARHELTAQIDFEGASQVLPGRWEFWMVGWPSNKERYGQEFILCASRNFCY